MDKEIFFIHNLLVNESQGLTTNDISKLIFEKHGLKISRTIVKNYLWSYFRNLIKYDSSNFKYTLLNDDFLLDDIEIAKKDNLERTIKSTFFGSKIKVEYNSSTSIETIVKALTIINYKSSAVKNNLDLIKQVNRVVEQIG
jgi:hypothetical protein